MKTIGSFLSVALFVVSIIFLSCSGNKTGDASSTEPAESEEESSASVANNVVTSACIWDQVPLRDAPNDKGKYITALSIGESIEEFADTTGNGKLYTKVRLIDGTEGYARKDFIVSGGKGSVFINDADTYNRPDALTKTDKKFSKYDIVAIVSSQNDFMEVKGKRAAGKWIESLWVKNGNLSDDKMNIATAKFISKALAEKDNEARAKALQSILDNRDLSSASFYGELQDMIDELTGIQMDTTGAN